MNGPRSRTPIRIGVAAAAAGLMALAGQVPAAADEGVVIMADSEDAIDGSYIVVLEDGESADAVAERHGGEVTQEFDAALEGFAAEMTDSEAKRAAADDAVAYVEQDQVVELTADQDNPPSWGLDRIDQRDLPLDDSYSYSTTASGVTAYIIDTGILTTHQDFGGRATWGTNTTGDGNNSDCQGHGTHVAGTVGGTAHGVAKEVTLTAVKVLGCDGTGSTSGVIAGVDWVTNNASGPSVANMSLGGGTSTALDDAVKRSIASGVTYALASGNGNFLGQPQDACNGSPSRVGGSNGPALTVNASTSSDAKGSFSNYGRCTDLYAPGVDITSAWIGSNTATRTISGTSMATPHVAGAAALYLADNTGASPADVKTHITSTASEGKISNVRSDTPNKLLFTGEGGGGDPGPDPDPDPDPDPTGCEQTNDTRVNIPDRSTVYSDITISDCGRNGSSSATISVDITHTYRGDLVIDLVAPNGDTFRLKNYSWWDGADNVKGSVTRDLSGYGADGKWRLRVQDVFSGDTGHINSWTLEL